jgi:hypothetical protein
MSRNRPSVTLPTTCAAPQQIRELFTNCRANPKLAGLATEDQEFNRRQMYRAFEH